MKTTMKKTAAYLLALLLVLQMVPAFADTVYSGTYTQKNVTFRDALEIIPALDVDILKVGMQNQLSVSDSYKDIQWESDHPEIATVSETGLVEAVGAGKVTITVTSEGNKYKDTISFKVIAETKAEEPKTEPEAKPEESGNGQEEEQVQDETIIIFIKGNKTKVEYNGKVQKNKYTVTTSNDALFDESKLTMIEDHLAAESNCGVWQDTMNEKDFAYDGKADIVVSNGWIQIKPAQIEIKADDVTINEGETPAYTASVVSGLAEGDTLDLSGLEFDTLEQNGETLIVPAISAGDIIGNYKVSRVISGKQTVVKTEELPLYYLAEISGTWYRLSKGTFKTTLGDVTKYFGKTIDKSLYPTERYDFTDLEIEIGGKKYIYKCDKNAEAILNGANYYTASVKNFEAIKEKIGGMDGNKPRWLVPESQRYNDPNKTNSYHLNYTITLYENEKQDKMEVQDLYNMLCVDGNTDYYRLRRTSIMAKPLSAYKKVENLKSGDYIIAPYDFTNVVIVIDGVEYIYSDHELADEYVSYYTVKFDKVVTQERINGVESWYETDAGWLDGSKEQYGTLPNNTQAFHANYNATTHKGKEIQRTVSITSNWPAGKLGHVGDKITLTAHLTGFTEGSYRLQWQYSRNGTDWTDQPGAEGETFTYELNETTTHYTWRVVVYDL